MAEHEAIAELDASECWELLSAGSVGRLAVAPAGRIDIFPVNYVAADGLLYFRTAPGSKLLDVTINPSIAFEIDGHDEATAFSVVVKGTAERMENQADIEAADKLPLTPWVPTLKYRWVRIRPAAVTGRSFRLDPEPDRY